MKRVREGFRLLVQLLRELGDENAYQRFLASRGTRPSAAEWRRFTDARHAAKFCKAKCC